MTKRAIATTHSGLSNDRNVAFQVLGGGADKIFKPGWWVIARQGGSANPLDYGNGDLLVIERRRGSLVERSVRKVAYKSKTSCKLVCPSTRKQYQNDRVHFPPKGDEVITVAGRVVGGSFDIVFAA